LIYIYFTIYCGYITNLINKVMDKVKNKLWLIVRKESEHRLVKAAAKATGANLSAFVREAALEKAKKILKSKGFDIDAIAHELPIE
jgi:uncharacterized protein (DUF1778 family)